MCKKQYGARARNGMEEIFPTSADWGASVFTP